VASPSAGAAGCAPAADLVASVLVPDAAPAVSLPPDPEPLGVVAADGVQIATYAVGEEDAPVVVAVHGFASSFVLNFVRTGWARDLVRAGFRVVGVDQRGHGASEKPHEPSAYSLEQLVDDLVVALDTHGVLEAVYVGYSLGARVGWLALREHPDRFPRAVLGGIPDGQPLTRFRTDEARRSLETGTPPSDTVTAGYLTMASAMPGNDVAALIALVDGLRDAPQPDPADPPTQPVLFATGSEDGILERSRRLAEAAPAGRFYEIPGRHHFNAPVSRQFREAAVDFVRGR
jgi:pimeloyl-ACP methyl ester carboxylesterase